MDSFLGRGSVIAGMDHGVDPSAHPKVALYFHPSWEGCGDKIIQDAIGDRLVEGTFVSKTPQIELEALEFDAFLRGTVANLDGGEIRLTRLGAQAGELRAREVDLVRALGLGVGEDLELLGGRRRHSQGSLGCRARAVNGSWVDAESALRSNAQIALPPEIFLGATEAA